MSEGINPIFERPIIQSQPIAESQPLGPTYRSPMLDLSDAVFPISLEERARRHRAEMRRLGINTPDVSEPESD